MTERSFPAASSNDIVSAGFLAGVLQAQPGPSQSVQSAQQYTNVPQSIIPHIVGQNESPSVSQWGPYAGKSVNPIYSWVLTNALLSKTSNKPKLLYRCKLCYIVGSVGKGPTNIERHFNSQHSTVNTSLQYEQAKKSGPSKSIPSLFKSVKHSKLGKQSQKQTRLIQSCAEWIATSARPLSIVEDDGFKKILREIAPRYNFVTRKMVLLALRKAEKGIDDELRRRLSKVQFAAGTTDAWTDSNGTSYCSLTVHFIDANWNYCSHLLACSKIAGRHTGAVLSRFLVHTCQKYHLLRKMIFLSVDNAANAKKQVRLTAEEQLRLSEIADDRLFLGEHVTDNEPDDEGKGEEHSEHEDADENEPQSSSSAILEVGGEEDFVSEAEAFMRELWEMVPATTTASQIPLQLFFNRQPCAAHTLQLTVKKALNSRIINSAIANVRKTCKFYRMSATGASFLRAEQVQVGMSPLRAALDVRTRWGSTLFMLRRFMKLQSFIDKATARLYREKFQFKSLRPGLPLTAAENQALEDCVAALDHIEEATTILGTEKTPSMYRHDPVLASVVFHLTNLNNSTQPGTPAHHLSSVLREGVLSRRKKNFSECTWSEIFSQVAALLFPFYRQMEQVKILGPYRNSDKDALLAVAKMCCHLNPSLADLTSAPVQEEEHRTGSRNLLSDAFLTNPNETAPKSFGKMLETEFQIYKMLEVGTVSDCPLAFWKKQDKLPILSAIARLVLTPPVTSTASERVFSSAGNVRQSNRSRLTPEHTEMILKVGHFKRVVGYIPTFQEP